MKLGSKPYLLKEVGQVWVSSTLANLLFYAFLLVVGRSLGPHDYGLFGALFGIIFLASAVSNAIRFSLAKITGDGNESFAQDRYVLGSAFLQVLVFGGIFLVGFSLASPLIADYLKAESVLPIVLTGVIVFVSLLVPIGEGALQGAQRFVAFGITLLLHGVSRLAFGLLALLIAPGVTPVLVALGASSGLVLLVVMAVVKPIVASSIRALPIRKMVGIFVPIAVVSLAISFQTSGDVILVRHFFAPDDAGLYAGTAVLGRVVLFLSAPVSIVLFSKVTRLGGSVGGSLGLLYRGLALTGLLSGGMAVGLMCFPGLAITLFLGSQYEGAQDIVPMYALSMFVFSLAVIFAYYHLALGRARFVYLLIIPHILAELTLIYLFHQSMSQVITVLVGVNSLLLVSILIFTHMDCVRRGLRRQHGQNGLPLGDRPSNLEY